MRKKKQEWEREKCDMKHKMKRTAYIYMHYRRKKRMGKAIVHRKIKREREKRHKWKNTKHLKETELCIQ